MDNAADPADATRPAPHPHLAALSACIVLALLLLPAYQRLATANIAMILLLAVTLVAFRYGRGPALLASVFNVAVFDVGFVPPRGSFTVHDAEYLIVFAVMLAVALIISHVSGKLHTQEQAARASEARQRALYELAAELNATLRREQVIDGVVAFLRRHLDGEARCHPADADAPAGDAAVRSVLVAGTSAQINDGDALRPVRNLQPLRGATRLRGVLETRLPTLRPTEDLNRQNLLSTVAELMAAALERLHYLDVAARTQSEIEAERLRNSLLATLSHDLRTPLTVLYGRADALREAAIDTPALSARAAAVCDEALRANRLCESLLDLAQARSTAGVLRRDWVALDEIIGAALATLGGVPGSGRVRIDLPPDLPWLQLDAAMFERVIANLIDNALKQGGDDQQVTVSAEVDTGVVHLRVRNTGSRFPDRAERLLAAFARGDRTDRDGFGIGLATCQAVVAAHGGQLHLRNRDDAAEVEVTLAAPRDAMPPLPNSEQADD